MFNIDNNMYKLRDGLLDNNPINPNIYDSD